MEGISIGNEKLSAFPHYTVCPRKNYNQTFRINNFQSIE